jgi:RNA polymerase sigma factor (sigma-70 family)
MTAPPNQPRAPETDRSETDRGEELRVWLAQYGSGLRRFFGKRAPAGEIDDLVQEVFMRLHARADTGPLENAEGYLFRTAGNVLIERRRYDTVHGRHLQQPYDEEIDPADDITPERALIARQDYARLIAAIDDLPTKTKAAFILHRFEQMTYPNIAKRMGISVSGVKHLMTRALDRLGEEMERP